MVEGSKFPVVSFGPLAHALCRLLPSEVGHGRDEAMGVRF